MSIQEKYASKFAITYKEILASECEGRQFVQPVDPTPSSKPLDKSNNQPLFSQNQTQSQNQGQKIKNEHYFTVDLDFDSSLTFIH